MNFRWPFNKSKHNQWLGINLSALAPSIVKFGKDGISACVNFNQEEGVLALESWLKANAPHGIPVVLVLDDDDYELLLAEAPDVPDDELSAAIEFRIGDLLSQPIEETAIQTMRLPADAYRGRMSMTHVVAVANKKISDWVEWAEKRQLKLENITVPEMSLLNILAINSINQGIALLDLGPKQGCIRIYQDGALYLTRHVEVGLDALELQLGIGENEPKEAAEDIEIETEMENEIDLAALSDDDLSQSYLNDELDLELELNPELADNSILDEDNSESFDSSSYVGFSAKARVNDQQAQNLILEVQRSLDYYESQLGLGQITQLWLMAGTQDLTDLVAVMQPALMANVEQPNMGSVLKENTDIIIAEECDEINYATIALGGALAYEPS